MARVPAPVVRSRLVLETAIGLLESDHFASNQALVRLRRQGGSEWDVSLFASDSPAALEEVANGKVTMGIINPSAVLTLASRGIPPFRGALPLRAIAVIPSDDQLVLAVREETGLHAIEEVAVKRYPLRVSLRGQRRDHSVHLVLDHILAVAGWSLADLRSWGGEVRYDEGLPAHGSRLGDAIGGAVDAIFDEAADNWVDEALQGHMRVLTLSSQTLDRLEGWGYRRACLTPGSFPSLDESVETVDFSGFAVYVHENAPDELVSLICEVLDQRSDHMYSQSGAPLSIRTMCSNSNGAPLDVPFHDAAARYWREKGYL